MKKRTGDSRFGGSLGQRAFNNPSGTKRRGGFDGERTRTEERYQKTRDAREALGYCSRVGTALRYALSDSLALIRDRYAPARINGLLMGIRGCDPEQETPKNLWQGLDTTAGRALLLGYPFQKNRKLGANIRRPFAVDMTGCSLTMAPFTPSLDLTFPKGTKMAGIQLLVVRIDPETLAYSFSSSAVATFVPTDGQCRDLLLEAAPPEGEGSLFAVLLSGFCDPYDGVSRWSLRQETAMGFVGFSR